MDNQILLLTILLPPFIGALVIGLAGRFMPRKMPGVIACAMVLVSLAASIRGFLDLQTVAGGRIEADVAAWFSVAAVQVRVLRSDSQY